ncbi:MAG TPA: RT0821/Lpp0805 family surface protein [Burkholderiales bacterium]|nr:RT0821/Lpp0805 family surface protein [Burkholderiales bacterium]
MKSTQLTLVALVCIALIPVPSPAEPPPHAKAHGWRKKNDPNYVGYTGKRWEEDYGVTQGKCNTAAVGAVVGGVVGGAIGSRADKEDRAVAIVLGSAIGTVVGAKIGKTIDESDRACMGHSLELAGRKDSVEWTNSATGITYRVTPTRNFVDGKDHCREFTTELSSGKGGKKDRVSGVACRGAKGEWLFKS